MNGKRGFTLVELLVVIAIIAVLMGILMPGMAMVRELAKRSVCLSNLKQMQLAWAVYADKNDEKIVRGDASGGTQGANDNNCWTGNDVADMYGRTHLPSDVQLQAVQAGLLYPYASNVDVYRCPTGLPGEMRTYSIVDSMNARTRDVDRNFIAPNGKKAFITNRLDIKDAANRMVFVDEGMATGDSFATYHATESWWDPAACRHSDGNTFSFADGHSEYWKWMGQETIDNGRLLEPEHRMEPETPEGLEDLYNFQKAVWGSVGYDPEF